MVYGVAHQCAPVEGGRPQGLAFGVQQLRYRVTGRRGTTIIDVIQSGLAQLPMRGPRNLTVFCMSAGKDIAVSTSM